MGIEFIFLFDPNGPNLPYDLVGPLGVSAMALFAVSAVLALWAVLAPGGTYE